MLSFGFYHLKQLEEKTDEYTEQLETYKKNVTNICLTPACISAANRVDSVSYLLFIHLKSYYTG